MTCEPDPATIAVTAEKVHLENAMTCEPGDYEAVKRERITAVCTGTRVSRTRNHRTGQNKDKSMVGADADGEETVGNEKRD